MPRGVKKEVTYTGKAAKINEKILKLEADLKAAKEELNQPIKNSSRRKNAPPKKLKRKKERVLLKPSKKVENQQRKFWNSSKTSILRSALPAVFYSFVKWLCFLHQFTSIHVTIRTSPRTGAVDASPCVRITEHVAVDLITAQKLCKR
jgi:hypothetical protein